MGVREGCEKVFEGQKCKRESKRKIKMGQNQKHNIQRENGT